MEGVFIQAYLSGATSLSLSVHPAIFDVSKASKQSTTRVSQNLLIIIYKSMFNLLMRNRNSKIHISLLYRLFEMVVKYFDAFLNLVPLSFVLGFYVSYVAGRWWQQFLAIPWPDK